MPQPVTVGVPRGVRSGRQRKPVHETHVRCLVGAAIAENEAKGGLHETFRRFQAGGLASQARLFGVGGLIQAAVGLAGGIGGLLTKRSGLSRNA